VISSFSTIKTSIFYSSYIVRKSQIFGFSFEFPNCQSICPVLSFQMSIHFKKARKLITGENLNRLAARQTVLTQEIQISLVHEQHVRRCESVSWSISTLSIHPALCASRHLKLPSTLKHPICSMPILSLPLCHPLQPSHLCHSSVSPIFASTSHLR
jgi:hypothetical protein